MRNPWLVALIAPLPLFFGYACGGATAIPAATGSPTPSSSLFGGTDLAWIELAIALDQQVLPLLDLVPAHSRDPAVVSAGSRLRESIGAELSALRALHDRAGLPAENPHEGMLMPGLVQPSTVAAAAELSGDAFDRVAARVLNEYLQQSDRIARSEQAAGRDPATRRLAAQAASEEREAGPWPSSRT